MNKSKVSIIVAMDKNRGIGKNNGLLWHIPEELKRFREITTGHPIIMGRKTYESIGRPLPNRTNIIITRDPNFKAEGCILVDSLEAAVSMAKEEVGKVSEVSKVSKVPGAKTSDTSDTFDTFPPSMTNEIFIIGGGQIYQQAMDSNLVDKLYITEVLGSFEPTVFFPEYASKFPKKVYEKEITAEGQKDGNLQTFIVKFLELERYVN